MAKKKRDKGLWVAEVCLILQMLIPIDDPALALLGKLALCTPWLVWVWTRGRKRRIRGKETEGAPPYDCIFTTVATMALVVPFIVISGRKLVLSLVIIFIIELVFMAILALRHMKSNLYVPLFMMFVVLCAFARECTYVSTFPFWKVSLLIGVLLGIPVCLIWMWHDRSVGERIGWMFICVFLSFMMSGICIMHLNYALDESEPYVQCLTIEDKDHVSRRKKSDNYYFEFSTEREDIRLSVSRETYRSYEIGDKYYLVYYKGALGEPYYLPGGGA